MEKFYTVVTPEKKKAEFCYDSEAGACKEAERLAELSPGKKFYVMRAVGVIEGDVTVRRRGFDPESGCKCPPDASGNIVCSKKLAEEFGPGIDVLTGPVPQQADASVGQSAYADGWQSHHQWEDMPCRSHETVIVHYFGHRDPDPAGRAGAFDWARVTRWRRAGIDASGWIPHTPGNPMPCEQGESVEVRFKSHYENSIGLANTMYWGKAGLADAGEIIAWRPAKMETRNA